MFHSPYALAALSSAARPDLNITSVQEFTSLIVPDSYSAILDTTNHSHLLILLPRTPQAQTQQNNDRAALKALSEGTRTHLPFDIPTVLGHINVGAGKAFIYTFLPGEPLKPEMLEHSSSLSNSLGKAIATVHSLPTKVVSDVGSPIYHPKDTVSSAYKLLEKSQKTGLLPITLKTRWTEVLETNEIWQFQPTVINGNLSLESFLCDTNDVLGVVGWSQLRVDDPAYDLTWALMNSTETFELVFTAYAAKRQVAIDPYFIKRTMLYSELEILRWLNYGFSTHQQDVIDDAVEMMDTLVGRAHSGLASSLTKHSPPIDVNEVETFLDEHSYTPRKNFQRSPGMKPVQDSSHSFPTHPGA